MNEVDFIGVFKVLLPEAVLTITALLVLMLDFTAGQDHPLANRMRMAGFMTALGCVAAVGVIWGFPPVAVSNVPLIEINAHIQHYKIALLIITLAVALLAIETDFTTHVGEYFALLLFATIGFLLLVSANNLLLLFIALELASLSLYLLTALDKQRPQSAEAGLKYFLFGGMAAACLLFGLSIFYGVSGHFYSADVGQHLPRGPLPVDPLMAVAMVLVLGGFAFKIAVVPFHLWAPDAYQGAPAPSAAVVASGSKVASFIALFGLVFAAMGPLGGNAHWSQFAAGWKPLLALMAALSMVWGNLAALIQNNVRRLLAYSAIAHSGYAVLAILTQQQAALAYYVITYSLAIVGAFGVIAIVERASGGAELAHFNGLARRSPLLAGALMIFLLSLAGIPPLAGFFGKFYIFLEALRDGPTRAGQPTMGLLYMVVLAIVMSTVSLYYYLQVLKRTHTTEPDKNAAPLPLTLGTWVTALLAAAVILLGCFPDWLLKWFR